MATTNAAETERQWEVHKWVESDYGCHDCGGKLAVKKNGKLASRCLKHLTQNREYQRQKLGCKKRYDNATIKEGIRR